MWGLHDSRPSGLWVCLMEINTTAGRASTRSAVEISFVLAEACVCVPNKVIGFPGWLCMYLHCK